MFDPKSDYARNKKDPDAIVYIDSYGNLIRLTRSDFASEEEFLRWKSWSDENHHTIEKADHVFSNHTLSLDCMAEGAVAAPSPEESLIGVCEEQERRELHSLLMEGLDSCLTPTQRRRFWLHLVEGLTVRQIAEIENVSHPSAVESLAAAKQRLYEFLKKGK